MRREFGRFLRLSVSGASHAPAISFALANFPAGFRIDREALQAFMDRRAPGRDEFSTARRESDAVEFESGIPVTTASPIRGHVGNTDVRPADYGAERTVPRPGHADFGQWVRFGRIPTGGGMNSGRMTVALCAAGGLCRQYLEKRGVTVNARLESVHGNAGCPEDEILKAKAAGDSVGGVVTCEIAGLAAGLGGALFEGVESELSAALFAIPGVKGVEFGNGFGAASLTGVENNDAFVIENGVVRTRTNRHGGVLGGRTTGMPLTFRVAMKPTPTVFKPQPSVDLATMTSAVLTMKGRHDPCIARRAVPVVEAVAAFVALDLILDEAARSPRICLTLTGATAGEDVAQYESERYFTDLVELRVDLLDPAQRANAPEIARKLGVPVILTFRRERDGGRFAGTDDERREFFAAALAEGGFAYVDFEDDFRDDGLVRLAKASGTRIIRSRHDFAGSVPDAAAVLAGLRGDTDEIPKYAFMPKTVAEVAAAFAAVGRLPAEMPRIVCAMGPAGVATRVLAGRTGSLLTYASAGGLEGLGHLTPHELVRDYNFRTLDETVELYGVTGWPLRWTRSPELHNAAFAAAAQDRVMIPLPAETAAEAVDFMRKLRMKGMAVTIPHKEAVMPLLDGVSPEAAAIGAVNTVSCEDGRLVGYNTDAEGFSAAIRAFFGRERLDGVRVALLGAGGAAKAVRHALDSLGAATEVFHRRTPVDGFDLIVNATPVDPIPDYAFSGTEAVYDLAYVPEVTPLIARARAAGCRTENGFSMLRAQAAAQRRIWSRG